MAKSESKQKLGLVGHGAFVLGVIIAVIAGVAGGYVNQYAGSITLVLVVLGFVVGALNIKEKETTPFLVAAIGLGVASGASSTLLTVNTLVPTLGTILQSLFGNLAVFVGPAALVVAVKAVWGLGRPQ